MCLDEKVIIKMMNRMIGSIHAHGETNHDNLAYTNLMVFDEVLGSMIDEVIDEAKKCNSVYFSEKRRGEYALTLLKNLHEYLQNILLDLKELKGEAEKVYVSVYHSFDSEALLYNFQSREEATAFIQNEYNNAIEAAQKEDYAQVAVSQCEDSFARIVFDNDTNDTIEWNICQMHSIY